MFAITPEKLALYKKNYAYLPDSRATLFLSKIYHLERLFALNITELQDSSTIDIRFIESTHYSLQSGPLIKQQIHPAILNNFTIPSLSVQHYSVYHNREIRALRAINKAYPFHFELIGYTGKEAMLFLDTKIRNFLCNVTIHKESRFDLYKKHAPYFLKSNVIPFFLEFVDGLEQGKKSSVNHIEIFDEQINIINPQPWSIIENNLPFYKGKAIEFFFQNIVENHIFSAIEQILESDNFNADDNDVLTININAKEKFIHTSFVNEEQNINICLKEENALLPDEKNSTFVIKIPLCNLFENLEKAIQYTWNNINVRNYAKPDYVDTLHEKFLIEYEHKRLNKNISSISAKETLSASRI